MNTQQAAVSNEFNVSLQYREYEYNLTFLLVHLKVLTPSVRPCANSVTRPQLTQAEVCGGHVCNATLKKLPQPQFYFK